MVSASLGNFRTEVAAGGIVRFGQQLSGDYGPLRVQPSLFSGTLAGNPKPFSWYVFAGVAGRAVGHDMTLDGNTFRDSPSVARKPFVGEWSAGIVVRVYHVKLSYSLVSQTPVYNGGGASQRFGAINLTLVF